MKIFSDIRILLNTRYSYGITLPNRQHAKKQLIEFLKKYSDIYGIPLIADTSLINESELIELDLIVFNHATPVVIYTSPPYHNTVWTDQQKKFLDAYKKGEWKAARFYINGLPNIKSSGLRDQAWRGRLAKYYDAMLARMDGEAPADWNGIFKIIES